MLKTLIKEVKQFKRDSLLAPFFIALEVIMEILIPLVTASIIDNGIEAGNLTYVYKYGILMVVLAIFSLSFGALAGKFAARASAGFAKNLRESMYQNIQRYSFSNIDKFSTAGLVTRMTTDVTNVQNAYQMILRMCVRSPLMLICAVISCFSINAELSSIFVVAILFLGGALSIIVLSAMKIFNYVFKKYDEVNASVQENVSAIRVVKAYVRESFENDKFTKAANNLYRLFVKAENILAFNSPVMLVAIYGSILGLSWFGAKHIAVGNMSTGDLTAMFSYVMNIMMSLMMISMILVMVTMSVASGKRITEVLTEEPDITNPENPITEIKDGSIDFNHVDFVYDKESSEKDTLQDIDIHIRSGETIGIIGGTGSGKSSLVSLISRLYDVKNGEVLVGGKDVRAYDLESLRNLMIIFCH